jgi:hypothetical protein
VAKRSFVNLRPETDAETEYVWLDRPRRRRVLARIIADLDELTGYPSGTAEERALDDETRRVQHRPRLTEPDPSSKPLTAREERAALREALGLPPHVTSEGERARLFVFGTRLVPPRASCAASYNQSSKLIYFANI